MAYNGVLANSNISAAYIDLATAWKMEGEYLYGATQMSAQYNHPCSRTYFMNQITRCAWFTQIPVALKGNNGMPAFGQEFSVTVTRLGEYVLNTWFRVTLPEVTLLTTNVYGTNGRIRWCRKLMHNLVEECNITFNDQQVARLDSYILDLSTQFNIPFAKRDGYAAMIGDTEDLTGSHGPTTALSATIPSKTLNLFLPFFYARDSGVALPAAAVLFNDIKINFKLRNWNELLILDNSGIAGAGTVARATPIVGPTADIAVAPVLSNAVVWSTYAMVNNLERENMANIQRDIIIEVWSTANRVPWNPILTATPIFEPRFTYSVRALYFAVRNTTFNADRSNYTTTSPYNTGTAMIYNPPKTEAPIKDITLNYDGTTRLSAMGWDYFSQVVPFNCCSLIPVEIGYGIYSYSLNLDSIDPNGSTNFSKINSVSIAPTPSTALLAAAAGTGTSTSGFDFPQTYEWVNLAQSHSVIRIADGQLTFPFV
jgi:hypothetical protein